MRKVKDVIYYNLVKRNSRVEYEYERYVRDHLDEHNSNRLKHIMLLLKLNMFYVVNKKKVPYMYYDVPYGLEKGMVEVSDEKEITDIMLIKKSDYFDEEWYREKYTDLHGVDPAVHYYTIGWREYRSPGPSFSTLLYLNRYDDVRVSGMNPLIHYEKFGKIEKRISSYGGLLKTINKEISIIEKSKLWDCEWYKSKADDGLYHIEKPSVHYYCLGCYLGIDPSPSFSNKIYEKAFPEVMDTPYPYLLHYECGGKNVGYLNKNIEYYANSSTRGIVIEEICDVLFDMMNTNLKKVLLVSHLLNLTGAPKVLVKMANILKKNGFYTVVATLKKGELENELLESGIKSVLLAEYEDNKYSEKIIEFANLFDIIMYNTIETMSLAHILRGTSAYKMAWIHEGDMTLNKIAEKKIKRINNVDRIFTCASYCNKYISPYLDKDNIELLHYGINSEEIETFKSHKKNNDKFTLIIVGTVGYRKGHDILFESINCLSESIKDEINIWVVGSIIDAKVGEQLAQITEEDSIVKYWGCVSNDKAVSLISEADLLICPSRDDPMPVVITEAFILNVPVLISKSVGTSDLIEDCVNGFLIEQNDATGLANSIERVYNLRNDLSKIGKAGYNVFLNSLSEECFEKNVLDIFSGTELHDFRTINVSNEVQLLNLEIVHDGLVIYFKCAKDNKLKLLSNNNFYYEHDYDKDGDLSKISLNSYLNKDEWKLSMIHINTSDLKHFSGLLVSDYFDSLRLQYSDYVWSNLKNISDIYGICVTIENNIICLRDIDVYRRDVEEKCQVNKEYKSMWDMVCRSVNRYSLYVETRDNANDNSFQLFKYELSFNDDTYYITTKDVIEKEKDEYLKSHYLVVNSQKAKEYMINSKYIVCSWYQPQLYGWEKMSLLYPFVDLNYIFVPHGISYDKNSYYLHKYTWGHFSKCFVASQYEKEYFEKVNSYEKVYVTGYPRMDKWMNNDTNHKIILLPTWRKNIDKEYINTIGEIAKVLINKEIVYIAHPSIEDSDFKKIARELQQIKNDIICIHSSDRDGFNYHFSSSTHLITDYSSVAYDFAYKGGKVAYYEPFMRLDSMYDILPVFYEHHCGKIIKDIDELRDFSNDEGDSNSIIERVNDFFEYIDSNNTYRTWKVLDRD